MSVDMEASLNRMADVESRMASTLDSLKKARMRLDDLPTEGPAIRIPITDMGKGAKFGETITDESRKYASDREPVGNFLVEKVATDIWDNKFEVKDKNTDNPDLQLNERVQQALKALKAYPELERCTKFERRYGYSVLVYQFLDEAESLSDPVDLEEPPEFNRLVPYPKTKIEKVDEVKDPADPRYGLPEYIYIMMNDSASSGEKVHWTRLYWLASRLDEHRYKGESVLDPVYDDMTVFRNIRWGFGQTAYRYGSGFADITMQGAKPKQIEAWENEGRFANIMSRTYFAHSETETLEFKGVAQVALNPEPYYEVELEQIAIGTGIPKNILRGAQAGALTGSQENTREYFKYISGEQSGQSSMAEDLVDKLIKSGMVETTAKEWMVEWPSAFELNEKDQTQIRLQNSMAARNEMAYKTINELRAESDPPMEARPEGNIIMPLLEMQVKLNEQRMQQLYMQQKPSVPQPTNQPGEKEPGGDPIGPWKNWAECIAAMKKEGYSEEEAEKICGSMEEGDLDEARRIISEKGDNNTVIRIMKFYEDYYSKRDVQMEASEWLFQSLNESLTKVLSKVKAGLSSEEAMKEADALFTEYMDKVQAETQKHIQEVTGVFPKEFPPEWSDQRKAQMRLYLDYFKKILDDSIRKKEGAT